MELFHSAVNETDSILIDARAIFVPQRHDRINQLLLLVYSSATVMWPGSDGLDCNAFAFVCLRAILRAVYQ